MTTFLLLGVLPIAGAWLLVELCAWVKRANDRYIERLVNRVVGTQEERVAALAALVQDPERLRIEIEKLEAS